MIFVACTGDEDHLAGEASDEAVIRWYRAVKAMVGLKLHIVQIIVLEAKK